MLMDTVTRPTTAELVPFALKEAPALLETVFPAQKVSFEAQTERKAVAAQTLTGLGSYWKGRKPLILVRAIVLGSLLPSTGNAEGDLNIFEKLMAFDEEGLARRALAANAFSPSRLQELISISDPERYFGTRGWRRDISDDDKLHLYREALKTLADYEGKASLCKRPEEVDPEFLYKPVWAEVNKYYAHLGISVHSFAELVEQLGVLRYGHRPRVADTFAGGGSIPYEAARIGCDALASDLNPVACMLSWGAFNAIGAPSSEKESIAGLQDRAINRVKDEIKSLKLEQDSKGNVAKAFLYCVEVTCPETGWSVPLSPSWVISPKYRTIAKLIPDPNKKRFDIEVVNGASKAEMLQAAKGTIQNGAMVYQIDNQSYSTAIKTLRGDYRDNGTKNNLRPWEKLDFKPRSNDLFQERLYAIQWISKETLNEARQRTFYASVTVDDLEREQEVEKLVCDNLAQWQYEGLVPDSQIEAGSETTRLTRERGWTYWHHLFGPRHLLINALFSKYLKKDPTGCLLLPNILDNNCKLCQWLPSQGGGLGGPKHLFVNQTFNTFWNYPVRATSSYKTLVFKPRPERDTKIRGSGTVINAAAADISLDNDIYITDPPYADAINYHEVTEFFIGWVRKDPPNPFDKWTWDSRRKLAVKGAGDDFRSGMVNAYKAMANHMPENGMQCVMFTHQDTGVWSDMVGIFWGAGLQVVGAWYIATETTSELKKGGYVQGTVILMLRKRPEGDRKGFTRRIYPAVHKEVESQIEEMLHLNQQVEDHTGEPVFNDADLQMAGYAAALKVLTSYTEIGGEDVTTFALRPRHKGDKTVVDDIVQQASETANSLLVPDGMKRDTWQSINGVQRFYLRMLDIESTGASKLDNYQNFAKAFRVEDYSRIMASTAANSAKLKQVEEMTSRDLMDTTELGATHLGHLMVAIQQLLNDVDIKVVVNQLVEDLPDYFERRGELIDMTRFLALKATNRDVRHWAEVLGDRIANEQLA